MSFASLQNDPAKAGQVANQPQTFGQFARYSVYAVHTRFDAVCWFVADAETCDEMTGFPAIIRQEATREAAMAGLA